jgi:hypothetical protein
VQNEMKNFLVDLICEIQEKYNHSLLPIKEEGLEEKNYRLGANFLYYDVLAHIPRRKFIMKSFLPIIMKPQGMNDDPPLIFVCAKAVSGHTFRYFARNGIF